MSHSRKQRSDSYGRMKYLKGIKRVKETKDKYLIGMDLKNGDGLVVDVTSNRLHYDDNVNVRRRMLKHLCQQHGAQSGVLTRIDEEGRRHIVEEWRYKA